MGKLIGIPGIYRQDFPTGIYQVGADYVDSVALGGGIPLMLPMTGDVNKILLYASMIDGLLLTGGGDIDPARYGESRHEKTGFVNEERDAFEFTLLKAVMAKGKPVFGICRGMQVMNVALGGTLYQDIPEQFPGGGQHVGDMHKRSEEFHEIRIEKGSLMEELFLASSVRTNSFHHQAVKKLAEGFAATAFSEEGVMEAMEDRERKLLGVEFHPENMTRAFPAFIRLFSWLTGECK